VLTLWMSRPAWWMWHSQDLPAPSTQVRPEPDMQGDRLTDPSHLNQHCSGGSLIPFCSAARQFGLRGAAGSVCAHSLSVFAFDCA
jgi:hypothetical protein